MNHPGKRIPETFVSALVIAAFIGSITVVSATPYTFNESASNSPSASGSPAPYSSPSPVHSINADARYQPARAGIQLEAYGNLPPALRSTNELNNEQPASNARSNNAPNAMADFMTEERRNSQRKARRNNEQTSSQSWFPTNGQQNIQPIEQYYGNRRNMPRSRKPNYGTGSSSDFENSTPAVVNYGNRWQSSFNDSNLNANNLHRYNQDEISGDQRRMERLKAIAATDYNKNIQDITAAQSMRQPDKFADNPLPDSDGVRRFLNGKRFDLAKIPLTDAIDATNSSRYDSPAGNRMNRSARLVRDNAQQNFFNQIR